MSDPASPITSADRAQFWWDTLADFAQSGLSVRAFCSARGARDRQA